MGSSEWQGATEVSLPPSSMCTLWTLLLNLSILDVPFPVLLSTLIKSRFQANLQPSWSPLIFPFLFTVEGTRYQSGSFSLFNVGSGFHGLRSFSFLFFPGWKACSLSLHEPSDGFYPQEVRDLIFTGRADRTCPLFYTRKTTNFFFHLYLFYFMNRRAVILLDWRPFFLVIFL